MDDRLTADEYAALEQISVPAVRDRPSACIARNAKRLTGLKYTTYVKNGKDGQLAVTEKGRLTLFVKQCIDGLRAIAGDEHYALRPEVITFLAKKGHITPNAANDGYVITPRGQDTLADIDVTSPK